jgi:RNA polymerase sigma-70 factor (ECF subfamily)
MHLSGEAQLSEPDLIDRARGGDGTAWEALVRQHQEPAFRLAYLILGDAGHAEDITQEAFLRAYRAIDRYDAERLFKPWLLTITANLARNQRRSLGRYWAAVQRFVERNPEPPSADHSAHIEEKVSQRWASKRMWEAIQHLEDKDQQIIYLRYFLDLPIAEAAEVLSVAEGTVKSRLHRALSRLQEVIEREFPELREGIKT